jgi:hypothetical protein
VAAYVNDLAEHLSLQTTSQEVIVSQVLRRLSEDARAFASLLSIFTVPFSRDVVLQVIAPPLRLTRTQAALQLRTFTPGESSVHLPEERSPFMTVSVCWRVSG